MEFLKLVSEYRWVFFIITESVFWVSLVGFFITRYWFGMTKFSVLAAVMIVANELIIFGLGVADFVATGQLSRYQVVIVIILIYTFTYGKHDFKKLDAFIERKVKQWKGEHVPPVEEEKKPTTPPEEVGKPDYDHARKERIGWFKHLLIYAAVQVIFLIVRMTQPSFLSEQTYDVMKGITLVWGIILIIDTFVSLSYTFFPRKKR